MIWTIIVSTLTAVAVFDGSADVFRLFPMPYGMGYMLMPSSTADSGLADLGELGRILNGFCLGFGPVGLQPEDVRRYADGDRE